MGEPVNPDEYDDPTQPPPGYQAAECHDCARNYAKPSSAPKISLGPLAATGAGIDQTASLCTTCRGRKWVWWPLSSVPPRREVL